MQQPLIQVNNLRKVFFVTQKAPGVLNSVKSIFKPNKKEVIAVNNVSFSIEQGELVGFLGPNGAGKTTTLKMLSGILYPTTGKATVLGFTPWERKKEYQKQFSLLMGQKNQLWWDLPVMDSFVLQKVIYGVSDRAFKKMTDHLAELLDVTDVLQTQARKLSLGQRMKCELIAALLYQPKVLFLDEPTIGLDVISQQAVREFIREYNEEFHTTILLTSHYMDDVEALCKRIIIIDHGMIVYDGSLQQLRDAYTNKKILRITFRKAVKKSDFTRLGTIKKFSKTMIELEVSRQTHQKVASKILHTFDVDDILIDEVNIEEVIRDIFSKK